MALME